MVKQNKIKEEKIFDTDSRFRTLELKISVFLNLFSFWDMGDQSFRPLAPKTPIYVIHDQIITLPGYITVR